MIVNIAEITKDSSFLEDDFVVEANDQFHKISDNVKQEVGFIDSKMVFTDFKSWIERAVKKRMLRK